MSIISSFITIIIILLLLWYFILYDPSLPKIINGDYKSRSKEDCAYDKLHIRILKAFNETISLVIFNIFSLLTYVFSKGMFFSYNDNNNDIVDVDEYGRKFGNGIYGKFDHKYTFCPFDLNGGSLMQFGATNSVFWSFPECDGHQIEYPTLKECEFMSDNFIKTYISQTYTGKFYQMQLIPRNMFGKLWKIFIMRYDPYFYIELIDSQTNTYKVQLILNGSFINENTLTDIWQILEVDNNGHVKMLKSNKLRNYSLYNGIPIGLGVGQGNMLITSHQHYNLHAHLNSDITKLL